MSFLLNKQNEELRELSPNLPGSSTISAYFPMDNFLYLYFKSV